MSVPEGTGSGENPSLFASVRTFWSVVVAILYTRLDLVTGELEDQAFHVAKLAAAGLIALIAFVTAFFFANFLIIVAFWHTVYRLWMIAAVTSVYLLIGIIAVFAVRGMIKHRPPFLSQTLTELRRDVESLSRSAAAKKDEVAP